MSAFPTLPLFTDAFIADTGHLSATETGAYLMLLMVAWRTSDCRLPDDDSRLAKWARVDLRTWRRIKATVMGFWTLADGAWSQKRLLKEREAVTKRAEAARSNGTVGGRSKRPTKHDRPPSDSKLAELNRGSCATHSAAKSLKTQDTANPVGSIRLSEIEAPISISIKKEEDGDDDARAREPGSSPGRQAVVTDAAHELAAEVARLAGHDPGFLPPEWFGAAYRVQTMLNEGFLPELILVAVRKTAAKKRDGPARSFAYFERAIASEHALHAAPLPNVVPIHQEAAHVAAASPSGFGAPRRDWFALAASLGEKHRRQRREPEPADKPSVLGGGDHPQRLSKS